MKKALAALVMLAALAACDANPSLDALREATAPTTRDAYQTALANNYREDAEQRATAEDFKLSRYFASKGLIAARGQDVSPENPDQWSLPTDTVAEATEARTKLFSAIEANRNTQPEMTAAAVVAYDRWLALHYNGATAETIAEQQEIFQNILAKLSDAYVATGAVPTTTTPPKSTSSVLYFPLDSDRLGDSAQAAVAELVRHVKAAPAKHITVNGHADRLGTEEYNMDLSERRASGVVKALEAAGITAAKLSYFAFGESDPAVPTEDEVGEPRNRRVEIYSE